MNRLVWAAALLAGAGAIWWSSSSPQSVPAAPAATPSDPESKGWKITAPPAELPIRSAANPHSLRTTPSYPDPEEQLAVGADQHLRINEALLIAFNHYLVDQAGEGDKADLLAYLQTQFPPTAFNEAVPLIEHYRDYLQTHDRQLAIQIPQSTAGAEPDLPRIRAWMAQRAQLRQRLLGPEAAQAWYQNDEAQLQQALDELEARQQALYGGAATGPVPHWSQPDEEARHVQSLRELLSKATTSFQSLQPRAP